jgi:DNA-binding transcriptional MerR regulator
VYSRDDVERLTFIRRCRDFDFSIEQVRMLVSLMQDPNSSCMVARDMAAEHLTAVRAKMRELKALERSLISFVKSCDTSCAGGPGPECVILGDLGKPSASAS